MKILIVNAYFYPHICGSVVYIYNLAREFIEKGHEVKIVCGGLKKDTKNFQGMELIIYKKPASNLSLKRKFFLHKKRAFELIKKIRGKFDLVFSGSHIFLNDLKKVYDAKRVVWIVPSLRLVSENVPMRTRKIFKKEIKSAIKNVELVVVSRILKKYLEENLKKGGNVRVVSPGVDMSKFNFSENKKNIVLFVGRIEQEKNVKALISAFSKAEMGRLVIVGGGREIKEVKKFAKKSGRSKDILFIGETPNPYKYYSKAKIFVLPSKYESFGLVLLEAMACGLPCIAFKPDGKKIITASGEIIRHGKTGFLVEDKKEMAEKIDLVLSDEKLWRKMSKSARREAEKYSWKKTADEILSLRK
jgi:glycosyltransferase involved in cell wall biosynthesis